MQFYCLPITARMIVAMRTIQADGSQTHSSSLFMTDQPHGPQKGLIPIGATCMGLQGKKYLVLSKGAKRAIPRPPFVKASRIPWLAHNRKKKMQKKNHRPENIPASPKSTAAKNRLINRPKKGEWKNPRCPKKWWYGIPREKAMTSASGRMEQAMERGQKYGGISRGANAAPAAAATAACVMAEGIIRSPLYVH